MTLVSCQNISLETLSDLNKLIITWEVKFTTPEGSHNGFAKLEERIIQSIHRKMLNLLQAFATFQIYLASEDNGQHQLILLNVMGYPKRLLSMRKQGHYSILSTKPHRRSSNR